MSPREPLRVLMPEDNPADAELVVRELRRQGFAPEHRLVESGGQMEQALRDDGPWDVILCDYRMPGFDAPEALRLLRGMDLDIPFILVSGAVSQEAAVEVMRLGAHDYVMKGELERLGEAVRRELAQGRIRREQRYAVRRMQHLNQTLMALRRMRAIKVDAQSAGPLRRSLVELLVETGAYAGAALVDPDGDTHSAPDGYQPGVADASSACGGRHLGTPVVANGRAYGTLAVVLPDGLRAENEELAILQEVAGDVGMALRHAALGEHRRRSEDRYKQLFDNMAQGVLYHDQRGAIIEANAAAVRILGLSREELQGRTLGDPRWRVSREDGSPFPPEDLPAAVVQRTGKPAAATIAVFNPTLGAQRWIHVEAVAEVEPGESSPHEVFSVFSDITALKEAEQGLRAERIQLDQVLETMPEALIQTDLERRITRVNRAFVEMFGYQPEEVIGKKTKVFYADPQRFEELGRTRYHPGAAPDPRPYEIEYRRKDGTLLPTETAGGPILDDEGRAVGLLGLVRDISERKRSAAEESRLQAKLAQAQKMESVGRLAGGVAHDFNNSLAVILLNTDLILSEPDLQDGVRADLEAVKRAAEKSAGLTRQLLAFARKETAVPTVLALDDVVEENLRMLRRLIGEDIELEWRPGDRGSRVHMDPAQVDQLLMNLLVNARDAIAGVGTVTVGTCVRELDASACAAMPGLEPGPYLVLSVSDDGHGMEADVLKEIFDPFFTTKEEGAGTGLGLATVYGIVQQNRGAIGVRSAPGRGTTFEIYLPEYRGEGGRSHGAGDRDEGRARGNETVLVVEDQVAILRAATRILSELGYRVLSAGTPGEAHELVAHQGERPDLLLTDVVMPQMNGRQLSDELRVHVPAMKTLFMSGYTADAVLRTGILQGEVDFLMKPFSKAGLASAVRSALDGRGSTRRDETG